MIVLKLKDSLGNNLEFGDFVKITNNGRNVFYSEVKYIENEKLIAPFHHFSFLKFEKVDSIPDDAIKANEERFDMWYMANDAESEKSCSDYLLSWRECERLIDKGCYEIEVFNKKELIKTTLF